jgi:hypothetical protein
VLPVTRLAKPLALTQGVGSDDVYGMMGIVISCRLSQAAAFFVPASFRACCLPIRSDVGVAVAARLADEFRTSSNQASALSLVQLQ